MTFRLARDACAATAETTVACVPDAKDVPRSQDDINARGSRSYPGAGAVPRSGTSSGVRSMIGPDLWPVYPSRESPGTQTCICRVESNFGALPGAPGDAEARFSH